MTQEEVFAAFHFLRPEWFHALIPAALIFALLRWRQSHHSNWEKVIDPQLLPHILDNPDEKASRSPLTLLLVAWLLGVLALAGPVWKKISQPAHEREDALVIIFDLTRSMLATDVKPDRLVRAKRKLIDLLALRDEGVTALVVFAGDAHTVSPLTDDTNTIASMIPSLSPDIMPAPGSKLAPAIERAIVLFKDAGVASGRILIITDEIRDPVAAQAVARQYRNRYPVSLLSVGTAAGAPVPLDPGNPQAGFLKDGDKLVIPRLNEKKLQDFADLASARYSPMTLTEEDLDLLLADEPLLDDAGFREVEGDFDVWFEEGPWLLLLLLPIASLAFRRGWVWCAALLLFAPGEEVYALGWKDLWFTKDEQGMAAMQAGNPADAADLFENRAWQATANYRSGKFEEAAEQFGGIGSGDGTYNLGNALAKQGLFEEALEAYDEALSLDPEHEDALFNRELIRKLLQEREQQREQQDRDGGGEKPEEQNHSQADGEHTEQAGPREEDQAQQQEQGQAQQQEQGQAQQQEQGQAQRQQEEQDEHRASTRETTPLDEEEKQALQQWLRRIPDDPGGLLKRKFQQQYDERLREGSARATGDNADW